MTQAPSFSKKVNAQRRAAQEQKVEGFLGFVTEKGSVYLYGGDGMVSRLKVSEGRGNGKFHPSADCVFVDSKHQPNPFIERIRFGYVKNNTYYSVASVKEIPEGNQVHVMVQDRGSDNPELILSTNEPEIGKRVIEKTYNAQGSFTHVGHKVSGILTTRAEVALAINAAEQSGKIAGADIQSLNRQAGELMKARIESLALGKK